MSTSHPTPLWQPAADAWDRSNLGAFAQRFCPEAVGNYEALWSWSVTEPEAFWQAVWDYLDVTSPTPHQQVMTSKAMPGCRWFEGAQINYAEHMLRGNGLTDDDVAILAESQSREPITVTMGELRNQVRDTAAGLKRLGVGRDDRVAGYLPNVPETLVVFLAAASLGAIWSSCAPEFGTRAVLDRWSQIEPSVLLVANGYRYGAKDVSCLEAIAEIREGLPSLQHTVQLNYLPGGGVVPDAMEWDELCAPTADELTFEPVPFDHPLYVLYSSGTTGLPKAIVHGHGGVLLEHGKELSLHFDLGPGDRLFWFSTTGWMMWNYVISGLLVGSSIVLFDGNPGHPDLRTLWSLISRTQSTFAGVSAPFIVACDAANLNPADEFDFSRLRTVGSTGAPLPASGFHWVTNRIGHLPIASISGGTDVCSAFLGSSPVHPTRAGVIACRQLGWDVNAVDATGSLVSGVEGELVITSPAPSMPVGFWGDVDGSRYHNAYFSTFPGMWRHGDWISIAEDGSSVVSGRSDATLNRGGVRLGTADFYEFVEGLPAVSDSLVVHLEDEDGGLGELVLFVVLADGYQLDDALESDVKAGLRKQLSPRHAPDVIVAMPEVPRTMSGKKLEVPVKRIILGADPETAASTGSLANADSLGPFIAWAHNRSTG